MIFNTKTNRCFIHIPKCAGTSVRKALSQYHDADPSYLNTWVRTDDYGMRYAGHLTASLLKVIDPTSYALVKRATIYSVIRDPEERFMSAFSQYCRKYREPIQYLEIQTQEKILGELIDDLRQAFKEPDPLPAHFTHFTPQVDFLTYPEAILKLYPISDVNLLVRDFTDGLGVPEFKQVERLNQSRYFKNAMTRRLVKCARRILPPALKQNAAMDYLKTALLYKGAVVGGGGRADFRAEKTPAPMLRCGL